MPDLHDLDQDIARLRAQLKELANEAKQAGCLQAGHNHMDGTLLAASATQLDPANQPQVSTGLSFSCASVSRQHIFSWPSGCLTPHSLPLQAAQFCATAHTNMPIICPPKCVTHPPDLVWLILSLLHDRQCPLSSKLCLCQVPPLSIPVQADVRSYNWQPLIQASCFDVIMMDPPWQLATANPTRGEGGACCKSWQQPTPHEVTVAHDAKAGNSQPHTR